MVALVDTKWDADFGSITTTERGERRSLTPWSGFVSPGDRPTESRRLKTNDSPPGTYKVNEGSRKDKETSPLFTEL